MIGIHNFVLVCSAAFLLGHASPVEQRSDGGASTLMERGLSPGSGTSGGYYYSYWTAGKGSINYQNGNAGEYSVSWSNVSDFTAGKGWNPGSDRTINYSGSFDITAGNALLSVYGWTIDPLIEYYILDSYGTDPSSGSSQYTHKGTVNSDGGTYNLYTAPRINAGSILGGNKNFTQFWSIRTQKRVGGTITTANHFNAWANAGMHMGKFDASSWTYQILSTEGLYGSSGSSDITS